jgi:ribA/ribD-fused uncharacterized protein
MIPDNLKHYWDSIDSNKSVVVFYSDKNGKYKSFSNFYKNEFNFKIKHGIFKGNTYKVQFAEKAIMLSKASLMGDKNTFLKILNAVTPHKAKILGRQVSSFNQILWNDNVCDIAKQVCISKFGQDQQIKNILLETGSCIIAEASLYDKIWGIGMDINDLDNQNITKWKGSNILGWALMQVRDNYL